MVGNRSRASGIGLERLCAKPSTDWLWSTEAVDGVELLAAWLQGHAYHTHRHDTYAIGLTDTGIQAFDYRGAAHISTPGQVVVLHPDELHDGHAETAEGFGYRIQYSGNPNQKNNNLPPPPPIDNRLSSMWSRKSTIGPVSAPCPLFGILLAPFAHSLSLTPLN